MLLHKSIYYSLAGEFITMLLPPHWVWIGRLLTHTHGEYHNIYGMSFQSLLHFLQHIHTELPLSLPIHMLKVVVMVWHTTYTVINGSYVTLGIVVSWGKVMEGLFPIGWSFIIHIHTHLSQICFLQTHNTDVSPHSSSHMSASSSASISTE